jgi:hypothetical protein
MPTHDDPHHKHPVPDASLGYEASDTNTAGVGKFLVALLVLAVVLFVVCFGIGKVINYGIATEDGPLNKWNQIAGKPSGKLENLASDPKMEQEELRVLTQRFPNPRLQTDDGDQDITDLHAREDLLLDHYSWIDQQQGKVRIPISRAMEMLAQSGLPVAPAAQQSEPLMAGDKTPEVQTPLTDGFARTGYEQEQLETMAQRRAQGEGSGDVAALNNGR